MEKDISVGFAFITESKDFVTISVSANPHLSAAELLVALNTLIGMVDLSCHKETCLHDIIEDIAAYTKKLQQRKEKINGPVN
jgi:hypothetical protein